jgi:hypothetical protein
MEGYSLYLDLEIRGVMKPEEIKSALNRELPEGIQITTAQEISRKTPSISSQISSAEYEVDLENHPELAERIPAMRNSSERIRSEVTGREIIITPLGGRKIKVIIPFSAGRGEKPNRVLAEYWGIDEMELKDLPLVCARFELS